MLILWQKNWGGQLYQLYQLFRNRILTEKTEESKILIISWDICTAKLFLCNKKFWKGADKFFHKESIILKENGKTTTDNIKISWNIY